MDCVAHTLKKTLVWNLDHMKRICYFPGNVCQLQDLREDLIFFFLTQCKTTLQTEKLKILQEEKVAHMDTIEFHKISSMTNE